MELSKCLASGAARRPSQNSRSLIRASILADVELPGMNGLDLLRHLGDEIRRVPVIIITGRGSDERVIQAIEAGAYWYIEKPLKPPVLRALLDRVIGRVQDQRAVAALTRQLREAGRSARSSGLRARCKK